MLLAALALLTAVPSPARASVEEADAFADARSGRVAFAMVDADGRVRGRRIHERHESASVVKAMLLVAYLRQGSVRDRDLTASERALLGPMITRSHNRAATRVRNTIGNSALARLARRVRMRDFATAPSWGSTLVSAYDQARFFHRIDRFVPRRHRGYALELLASVVADQRWGLPQAVGDDWRVYLKGGWRRDAGGRLVNQVALLRRGDERVAIAVLTDANPTYGYGIETVRGVGRRLLR